MKAAVLHQFGEPPRYEDFPDPQPEDGETVITVKAVALENVDRFIAADAHFAARQFLPNLPAIVGFDGIGTLPDGKLVGFGGIRPPYGAMAERVAVRYSVSAPDGIAAATFASVPASALTGLFPLRYGAQLQPGQTVLINGATGFAGKLAVQIAKLLGAGRVVGTGRHAESLKQLADLGADAVIDLKQSDEQIVKAFAQAGGADGYHIILDFLWGHPTELLLEALTPHELAFAQHPIRLVQIGEMAGNRLSLPAETLRTSGLEIVGGAAGITPEGMAEGADQVYTWLKVGALKFDLEIVPLKDIEAAWQRGASPGQRIVIVP
jgi:NADPH2:quinone reductase